MHFCALLTIRIGTLAGPIPTIRPLADFLHSPPSPPNLDSSYRLGNAGRRARRGHLQRGLGERVKSGAQSGDGDPLRDAPFRAR